MPEHFHLLLTPANELTLERVVQLIKGGYSHAVGQQFGKKMEIWERGFTDHRIRDLADFHNHREYIHNNPVERGVVAVACEFRYCSAYPGFKLDPRPAAVEAGLGAAS
jgi:putative transposase